jgi:16S rRNA processing protein RimM
LKRAEWQAVGRVQRTEGQGGALKVRLYPGISLGSVRSVRLERRGEEEVLAVESARTGGRSLILKIKGIDSRDGAEALTGQELKVPGDSLLPAGEGFFYPGQLLGCRVLTRNGADLGEVKAVIPVGESGLLVVGRGEEEVLIPLARDICYEIDPAGGRIRIDPPEGLLNLNEI